MTNDFIEISTPEILPGKPVASVLLTAYNLEKYLGQAIEGVVSQVVDFPIELIIGEDCSSDKTRDIALEYQKQYPNLIRVIYSDKNVGLNRNYSRVLSLCRGDYVAVCDGDDIWINKTKLQKQVDFLERNQEYVFCHHGAVVIDENDNIINQSMVPDSCKRDYTKGELQRGAGAHMICSSTRCYRNVVRTFPDEYFRLRKNSDRFLTTLLGGHGSAHYMHDLESGVLYRKHPGGDWSMLEQHEKMAELSNTYYWLSVYFQRMGKQDLANYYIKQTLGHMCAAVRIDNFALMRFVARRIYRSGLGRVRTYILGPAKRFLARCGVLITED